MYRARALLCALVGAGSILAGTQVAEAMPFTFTLSAAGKTSAGVFSSSGVLVKTLWSGVSYGAGTFAGDWDQMDDSGHAVADGSYEIRVLSSQATYTWDGVVGNTSDSFTGGNIFHFMSTISGMAITGTNAYVATQYEEAFSSQARFSTSDTGSVTRILDKGAQFFKVATDGTNVYWAGNDANVPSKGFVMATAVSDDTQVSFSHGTGPYTAMYGMTYTSTIDLETDANALPTGLAVQTSGAYLFVSRSGMNSLNVIDKATGQVVHALTYTAPGELAVEPGDGYLWMIHTVSGAQVVQRFAINSDGTLTAGTTITGLASPLALGTSGTSSSPLVLVADGGSSQQVKAFDASGTSEWTLGQAGGYSSDATAADDKFDFEPGPGYARNPYIAPAASGSFWLGDPGDYRNLLFSSSRTVADSIAYVPTNYSVAADPNDPTRVFASYVEYHVDYSKSLGGKNGSWSLAKNWRPGVTYDDPYIRMEYTTTLSNGRTYTALGGTLYELPASGQLRNTGVSIVDSQGIAGLFADGSVRYSDVSSGVETWYQKSLAGFDGSNNPIFGSATSLASTPLAATDPQQHNDDWNAFRQGVKTSGNVLVAFDGNANDHGWHLGGIAVGGTSWLWKASPSTSPTFTSYYPSLSWQSDGSFDVFHGLAANAGGAVMATDRHIFYKYRGNADWNIFRHYYDDGLLVNEFGNLPGVAEGTAGYAGNSANQWLVKLSDGRVFIYSSDESAHGGVHRWSVGGLDTVSEQTTSVTVSKDVWPGLYAEYFDTPDFNSRALVTTRPEGPIDFSWGGLTPPNTKLTDNQTFSVRWSGFVVPTTTETYTFQIDADDSAKVWVDGTLVAVSGTPGTIALTSGVSYPIRVEYKQGTGTAGVSLKWSYGSVSGQVIPQSQLYNVPKGTYMMAGLPSSGPVADGTAGWTRVPATDNGDYWHGWHVDMLQNGGNPYLHVQFDDSDANVYKYVRRDLGTASTDTAAWQVNMNISFNNTYSNHDPYCGQKLELLDDSDKAIAELDLRMYAYPNDGRLYANGKFIAQDTVWTLTYALYPWYPLSISAADGQITFQYGNYPPVTAAQQDPTADWRKLKTFRLGFYTAATSCAYDSEVNIDGLSVSRTPTSTGTDMLDGVPHADAPIGGDSPWLDVGDYGWTGVGTVGFDYWEHWSIESNRRLWNPKTQLDLGTVYISKVPGTTKTLTRDLGMPSDNTTSWTLSGQVQYEDNYINHGTAGGQYLDVLDDANKVIARFYPVMVSYPNEAHIYGNSSSILTSDVSTVQFGMWSWQPLTISASNGQITFQYGTNSPVTTGVYDSSANWKRAKYLRSTFWSSTVDMGYNRAIDFSNLSFKNDTTFEGLVLKLDASTLTGSDGDAIATWPDGSGRANDSKQWNSTYRPVLKTGSNGLNSLNVVRFDGADDFLQSAFDSGPNGFTVFFVARTGSSVPYLQAVLQSGATDTSGANWGFGLGSHVTYGAGWGNAWATSFGSVSGIAANKAFFGRFRSNNTAWSIDGVNSNTPSDPSSAKGLFNAFLGAGFNGDIAEVRVYNKALTDTECASIKSEMKTKWGLP
jgi:hypothetical protein